jgi:hypothetical protein
MLALTDEVIEKIFRDAAINGDKRRYGSFSTEAAGSAAQPTSLRPKS